jgi:hypothetical protein
MLAAGKRAAVSTRDVKVPSKMKRKIVAEKPVTSYVAEEPVAVGAL